MWSSISDLLYTEKKSVKIQVDFSLAVDRCMWSWNGVWAGDKIMESTYLKWKPIDSKKVSYSIIIVVPIFDVLGE